MNLSPTSRTLFLVQIGTFVSGLIVIVCCCLYFSAYPKSPEAEGVSAIACATLAFALISTITTLVLVLRQKSGRTLNAAIEGCWVGFAILMWILAAVGGIAKPANGMTNVSCKVLPSGKSTDDKNFLRACQSMFASTAFCIVSALFFIATAGILITFAIQRAVRDKKAAQVKVGGTYQLGPSPSQYRRAEQHGDNPTEEPKHGDMETGSPSAAHSTTAPATPATPAALATPGSLVMAPATTSITHGGSFSQNVYQTPVMTTPAPVLATPAPAMALPHATGASSPYNTYSSGGHVPQASYQSAVSGGYDYNTVASNANPSGGYFAQGTGHVQQPSNMSASAYDQYNAYSSSGNVYPQQMPYPQQTTQEGGYPMMGPPHQQSPYGTQYMNQQPQGQGPQTPVMAMPRPEHF
ncbi:hypothetical protein KVV02_002677 [Mortierella alpina]|uniref:MARVEL domain-containing protein n=1 Tax=Mortierella alpina TaxID=64518 RepID=A0A9P8D2C9_MORAP|nr:hypothetical protein KVV02_002677 [Mortierella alpina]